jgi:hypothetical protein
MVKQGTAQTIKERLSDVRATEAAVEESTLDDPKIGSPVVGKKESADALILPTGGTIVIREMTGVEEDILTNRVKLKKFTALNDVLQACIVELNGNTAITNDDVLSMVAGDRMFVLYTIRKLSYGPEFNLPVTCLECKETTRAIGSLDDDVVMTPYPHGDQTEFTFILPKSGDVVVFEHLDGYAELRLAKLGSPSFSDLLLMQIKSVNGKAPDRRTVTSWSALDRNALRDNMRDVAGGIDLVEEMFCGRCGAPIPTRLDLLQGFLIPMRGRTKS